MWIQRSFTGDQTRGTLYLVATPIGNLEDMTFRAIDTLKKVDLIAAEDTRQTRKLLTRFDLHTRLVSYHEHNKTESGPELIRLLQQGNNIALVSDAGVPAISDPGMELVAEAVENEINVVPIPGANAGINGLIASGLSTHPFLFIGFLPRDKKELNLELERLRTYPETIVIYEAPHRLTRTLEKIYEVFGDRPAAIARELTKKYEEFIRGSLSDILKHYQNLSKIRGEICIIVKGNLDNHEENIEKDIWWASMTSVEHVNHYIEQGNSVKDSIKQVAEDRGVSKRNIYNLYHAKQIN